MSKQQASYSVSTAQVLQAALLYVGQAAARLPTSQPQEFSSRRPKMCLTCNTVYRPVVSKMPLKRSLKYSYEWFLENEAACTHALQKDLEVPHAPRKVLVVMVMKREEDNTIIVVVTVEGVKAAEPGFKERGHGYDPNYGPRGGKCTKLQQKYT